MNEQSKIKAKSFTLDEANKALALVRPIAEDLKQILDKIRQLKIDHSKSPEDQHEDILKELQTSNHMMLHHLEELKHLGVFVTDLTNLVIDFPGNHEGKEVYFCWKHNEPGVYFYHGQFCEQHERKYIYNLTKCK